MNYYEEDIINKREDLKEGISNKLKTMPVEVSTNGRNVLIKLNTDLICGVCVNDKAYRIFGATPEWAGKTTYLCEESIDGVWQYYLDTIDECIGEVHRMVFFELQKEGYPKRPEAKINGRHTSDLSRTITAPKFEAAYRFFIEQADKNAVSNKAQGIKIPYGFSKKPICDGAGFKPQYGQGAASKAPYMNWWVVSIYYMPNSGYIMMGIEEDRYPHLGEMTIKPIRYAQIGNKTVSTAVFYETTKENVDYEELYESFINVCEEVMRLGLR